MILSIANMNSLPVEIIEMILQYLTYQEMGRVMGVNKQWKMLIDRMIPPVRQFNIKDMWLNCIGQFGLHSTFKGNPVYVTQYLWLLNEELTGMFLYQLDGYWIVSSVPGVLDEEEGYLKSNNALSTPPDMEWKWCKTGILIKPAFKIKLQDKIM